MGLRVRRSITICKGVRVNFGKTGTSLSVGGRGFRKTFHSNGKVTKSVGIPGTGIYWTESSGGHKISSPNYISQKSISSNRGRQQLLTTPRQSNVSTNQLATDSESVRKYDEYIDQIRSVHKNCDEYIDWTHVEAIPEPFNRQGIGPHEAAAIKEYNEYKPSFIEKMSSSKRASKEQELKQNIIQSHNIDQEDYKDWEDLHNLSEKILACDLDSFLYVIDEMKPFDDLLEYGSDFEVGLDDTELLQVEFHVKSSNVVPNYVLSLTKTGKLSKKEMTKTMYYDYIQDYVCSTVIRIARDCFALLPVYSVIIHAVDNTLDTTTGYYADATILSARINRVQFATINFDRIDPSDFIESVEHNMIFKKTTGFQPVERLEAGE
jgi:hypothetical protein